MSTLKTNIIQLGQSATASENFTLTTGQDGTMVIARGNPGATTQDIITVDAAGSISIPNQNIITGSVNAWPVAAIPSGFLECNGQSLDTTTYATLFAVLGYTYGGSGASFNVPDYRGEFLRGFDNAKGSDPDRASRTDRGDGTTGDNVGTKQAEQLKNHAHIIDTSGQTNGAGSKVRNDNGVSNINTSTTRTDGGGNETRPRNVNVIYIIKV